MTTSATFAHDDTLPRIPLPTLEESAGRFLEWCAPLLDDEQYAATGAALAEFLAGPGPLLQEQLEKYDATDGVHSWLDTFWPYRYLGRRDRIALNANFFFLFRDEPGVPQIARAAGLIAGALAHKHLVDTETLPPTLQRGTPLTMDQQKYLFSTTRIPGEEQDTVRSPYGSGWPGPSPARHVLVLRGGSIFRLDVLDDEGRPYANETVAARLADVVRAGPDPDAVGHLTTRARADWAADRRALLALDPANAQTMEVIETALFCVCLEDAAAPDDLAACDQLLHGDNRWFDKAVSFVVFADGRAGINVEHCLLDGTTVLAFVDSVLARSGSVPEVVSTATAPSVSPVRFALDETLRSHIREAAEEFTAYADATATTVVDLPGAGATRAKELGVSPDAFFQIAYQVAHRRAKGLTGATYESIATRTMRRGRTEAMRVVTPEMVRAVDVLTSSGSSVEARRGAFRAAADAHVRRAKECAAGHAPEQHLWELQLIQRRDGLGPDPAFFSSPGWTVMRSDYLSTSSAPSTSIEWFGFGSTSAQCIGVGYVLLPDSFRAYLSSPRSEEAGLLSFADHLRDAVPELIALLS